MAQARALETIGETATDLKAMVPRVLSGDTTNLEAQAARRYWPRMLGGTEERFSRDRSREGVNGALNYGYAVLRAGAARSILTAGLHPSLSVHHVSRGSPLRLADDIMEPFRPWVDVIVRRLAEELPGGTVLELGGHEKSALVDVLTLDLEGPFGASPIQTCLNRLCQSLAEICQSNRRKLELPGPPIFDRVSVRRSI